MSDFLKTFFIFLIWWSVLSINWHTFEIKETIVKLNANMIEIYNNSDSLRSSTYNLEKQVESLTKIIKINHEEVMKKENTIKFPEFQTLPNYPVITATNCIELYNLKKFNENNNLKGN